MPVIASVNLQVTLDPSDSMMTFIQAVNRVNRERRDDVVAPAVRKHALYIQTNQTYETLLD